MKFIITGLIFVVSVFVAAGQNKLKARITKEQATKTALEHVKDGKIQSAELEKESGKLIWSFDIKAGEEIKEVWVDANTGAYLQTETESAADEKSEKATVKAERAALTKVPGEVVKTEVEKKKGKTLYTFEIKSKDGKMVEVEVDATTNKVLDVSSVDDDSDEKNDEDDD